MNSVPHKLDNQDYKRWLKTDSALRLLSLQSAWLQTKLRRFSGAHLMFHGLDPKLDLLSTSPIKHAFRMALPWQTGITTDAWMTSSDWPLADQSIDLVVMQHSLDFTRQPQQMIREAARTIVPSGHLVIIGFNPWSWWGGVQKTLPFSTNMPWVANAVSMKRLQDWLLLLDFSIQSTETLGHLWPITLFPERVSQRIDGVLAGSVGMGNFYMVIAQKTTLGMTSLRSRPWPILEPQLGWAKNMGKTKP
ncbi:MAG: SAM-dependent methyltransferase [Oleispira sp.]|jgi:SAM-dependent methyltransferase